VGGRDRTARPGAGDRGQGEGEGTCAEGKVEEECDGMGRGPEDGLWGRSLGSRDGRRQQILSIILRSLVFLCMRCTIVILALAIHLLVPRRFGNAT
jgi:hypothetical protein